MKYRKKPVVIEAFQMTEERRWDNSEWPVWLNIAWNTPVGEEGSVWCGRLDGFVEGADILYCGTLEGPYRIDWDDYIVQGVKGELYPCKPDIFEETYEPA